MNYKLYMKRFAIILIIVILLLAIIFSGAYFFASKTIKQEFAKLSGIENSYQPNVKCNKLEIDGFPFKFNITCQQAIIIDGDARFEIENIEIKYSFFSPMRAQISATSPLKYSNEFFASKQEFRWDTLKSDIALNGWKLKLATLDVSKFEFVDLLFGENIIASSDAFKIIIYDEGLDYDPIKNLTNVKLNITGKKIDFKNFDIESGELALNVTISRLPADIRLWGSEEILRQWQMQQGEILLKQLSASDFSKQIDIYGKAHLDSFGFLTGEFEIDSKNIVELIAPNFPVEMQPIIFGSKDENGSYSQSIIFKNGNIYSGLLPIGQIPALL